MLQRGQQPRSCHRVFPSLHPLNSRHSRSLTLCLLVKYGSKGSVLMRVLLFSAGLLNTFLPVRWFTETPKASFPRGPAPAPCGCWLRGDDAGTPAGRAPRPLSSVLPRSRVFSVAAFLLLNRSQLALALLHPTSLQVPLNQHQILAFCPHRHHPALGSLF